MNFLETESAKELLTTFLSEHLKYIKSDLTNTDIEVMNQRTRFYKCYCWLFYAHIFKKNVCSRCGYIRKDKP